MFESIKLGVASLNKFHVDGSCEKSHQSDFSLVDISPFGQWV